MIAIVFPWLFYVRFAYIANKIWVFEAIDNSYKVVLKEVSKFVSGRIATLIIEELILVFCIIYLGFNSIFVKLAAQVIVILLNYVVSKFWVFEKNNVRLKEQIDAKF